MSDIHGVREQVEAFARELSAERAARQQRRSLAGCDFERLRKIGFLRWGIPIARGGLWQDTASSTRAICESLAVIAEGDPSLALVIAMHPAVLLFWLAPGDAPEPYANFWDQQREMVFRSVEEGAVWGTLTSEPGSGGDVLKTRTVAKPEPIPGSYRLTGTKHFGSGSGQTSFMITLARCEGERAPDLFMIDMREHAWDGSSGLTLLSEWDGHGMAATQSHSFALDGVLARRCAWPGSIARVLGEAAAFSNCAFSAVAIGVMRVAVRCAQERIANGSEQLRAFEQVEWVRVENESWLAEQAFEGMLCAVETQRSPARATLHGKLAIAELAESALARLCRVIGGSSFSRSAPFGTWAQDVRALGFLRPPWALSFEQLARRSA